MKATEPITAETPDLELEHGCLLCGGTLSIRLRPGTARSVCRTCGWWSKPLMEREEDGMHVHHRASGRA